MILELGIIAAGGAIVQTIRAGIPVRSGTAGTLASGPVRWRVRWALWRWLAEAYAPDTGWTRIGEFGTRELAQRNAELAAAARLPMRLNTMQAVTPTAGLSQK